MASATKSQEVTEGKGAGIKSVHSQTPKGALRAEEDRADAELSLNGSCFPIDRGKTGTNEKEREHPSAEQSCPLILFFLLLRTEVI